MSIQDSASYLLLPLSTFQRPPGHFENLLPEGAVQTCHSPTQRQSTVVDAGYHIDSTLSSHLFDLGPLG